MKSKEYETILGIQNITAKTSITNKNAGKDVFQPKFTDTSSVNQ